MQQDTDRPAPPKRQQLQMRWPSERKTISGVPPLPAGYRLRRYRGRDFAGYLALLHSVGFDSLTEEAVRGQLKSVLWRGLFLVEERGSGRLVATARAERSPSDLHPDGGQVGYVATDAAHRGRGLGAIVTAAAVKRLLKARCRRIYLLTDAHRLPALKVYLKLGFQPFLFAPDMPDRWREVCRQLDWPFTPEDWPGAGSP